MSNYKFIKLPEQGEKIRVNSQGKLNIGDNPIICFIEGDGIGTEITKASMLMLNCAIDKAYNGRRSISWMEVYAGEKAKAIYGGDNSLPEETLSAIRDYVIAIKGPLTTPVGSGIRSLNVALRHSLDLYVCLRPVKYFKGVPSPLRNPELTDMVVFRENSEDIYAGIEWQEGTREVKNIIDFLVEEMGVKQIRFPGTSAIGVKPVSREGTERLVRAAMNYSITHRRKSVTLVHKGNIMKFTEGAFRDWGYSLVKKEFSEYAVCAPDIDGKIPAGKILVKDCICDAFLQEILVCPQDYDVIATLNLNGDYISDALAACVGGIGIAPGANINYITGAAIFEATHGTAPKLAGQNKANPCSLTLSGEMMLRYMGWDEAANILIKAIEKCIASKKVTCDFARFIEAPIELSCTDFAKSVGKYIYTQNSPIFESNNQSQKSRLNT